MARPIHTHFHTCGIAERIYGDGTITLAIWDPRAVRRAVEYAKPGHQQVRDWQARKLDEIEADLDRALNGDYPPRDRLGDDD